MEMGIDRILFSVDYPFVANPPGVQWMETVPLCDEDKAKIAERQRQAAVPTVAGGELGGAAARFPLRRRHCMGDGGVRLRPHASGP